MSDDNELLTIDEAELDQAYEHLHSIRDYIRFIVSALRKYDVHLGQGTEDFFAEANAMVFQSLALDWSADEQILDARLLPAEKKIILELLQSRINQRVPLAYLLNISYFAGLPFYVDERVLIPRSPIAELIATGFAPYFETKESSHFAHGLPPLQSTTPDRILDLCTGSGCIAIALAKKFEDAQVDAVDLSQDALGVAAINVGHHSLEDRIHLLESDLFDRIEPNHQYNLVVSNPPYVDAADMADLPPEFIHEPEMALAAGQDGLDLVKKMLVEAPNYLTDDGLLVVEVGNSEWHLKQAFPKVPFNWLQFEKGGKGVFSLTAKQLKEYASLFKAAL